MTYASTSMEYESVIKNLDKDVEDLEQLRTTPLLADCNNWDKEIHTLKTSRDILIKSKKSHEYFEQPKSSLHSCGDLPPVSSSSLRKIPPLFRKLRYDNQVGLIKTLGEVEERLNNKALDHNESESMVVKLDIARQQLGYARQEANRKLSEMGFWTKAASWFSSKWNNLLK